ncbi:MAG: hypothetical protein ACK5G7_04235 [Erysipelotrichaceae bacterium]
MKNWHSRLEMLLFPIKILFVAVILQGIGNLAYNPIITSVFAFDNEIIVSIFMVLRYIGNFIITNFPLLILIKMVGRRQDSSTPIFAAVLGYIVFISTCSFVAYKGFSSEFYYSILGISVNMSDFVEGSKLILKPFQMGVIASIVMIYITRFSYRLTRKHNNNFLAYMDRDTTCFILTMTLSVVGGILLSVVWPVVISLIESIMLSLAGDISNPINLFWYGIFDRVMSLLGLSSISQTAFWFGSYGGSWLDANGVNFLGDINIWTAQSSNLIVSAGAGRLITPYYILNFFAIPGVILVMWNIITKKEERRKLIPFVLIAISVSVLFGSLLPFELFLLVTAPVLFGIHLVCTGFLFAILQITEIFVGYTYIGSPAYAAPGGFFDWLPYFNDTVTKTNLLLFVAIGVATFAFYIFVTYIYFNYLALDVMNIKKRDVVNNLLLSVGGVGNIINIHSSYDKVTISVLNSKVVNFDILHDCGIGRIVENRDGFNIYFGSDSFMIRRELIKTIKGELSGKK